MNKVKRIFYAASGTSNLIGAHQHWVRGIPDPTEVSTTFSSQIEDYCRDQGAMALLVSTNEDGQTLTDGQFTFEHVPKRKRKGIAYHVEQMRYGFMLLMKARKFRADLAIIDSGATHYFFLLAFPLLRIPVIVVLHNALWPKGFRPTSGKARAVLALDTLFWKRGPAAVVAVSPECAVQVRMVAPNSNYPIVQTRAQFQSRFFADILNPPPHEVRPFRIMFAGRIMANKGSLDIVRMALVTEQRAPGLIQWVICGDGPDAPCYANLFPNLASPPPLIAIPSSWQQDLVLIEI